MAHARQIGAGEARRQADRLVDGRHAEQDRHAARGDQVEQRVDLELGEHRAGAAGEEQRQRVQIDAGGVEQRQEVDRAVGPVEARRLLHVDVVGERHADGLDHGLGPAGGAGGVEQIPDAVRRPGGVARGRGRRLGDQRLARVEGDEAQHRADLTSALREVRGRRIVQEQLRAAVGEDGRQLRRRLAPVERHQDRAGLAAGEQHLEERRRVVAQDGDALAGGDAHPLQRRRAALGPVVEGGEGDPAARRPPPRTRSASGDELGALGREIEHGVHALASPDPLCPRALDKMADQ